ncbi:class I SAM-dependent methyltransferase [Culicoidibacter larvae]|uniref:Class I SAM-dependent methyltransferase n=1 Tax=Culicoidibacter larvae TaxID=2579976 RepID=A0A5R8QJ80_9FIRM|nr:class I SAM-dependent methyltransferase [Culicoidibacter larvae]TLG77503.1 class I SAM-dependent methyltransferase [Culicoidibacter larvae]
MEKSVEERLAESLTATSTELLQYLPYLLQDFWELGSSPQIMSEILQTNIPSLEGMQILDLGCGKGAVSVALARTLSAKVTGIDIIPEFIEYAKSKAQEFKVSELCTFIAEDINQSIERERNYDCVVFGAVGAVLGAPAEMLPKLKQTVKPGGYILIDEAYLAANNEGGNVAYQMDYLTREQWLALFEQLGLELVDEKVNEGDLEFDEDNANIKQRADELKKLHPEQSALFDGYVQSQLDECYDLENNIVGVVWLLRVK